MAPASAASGPLTVQSGGIARKAIIVERFRLKQARRPVVIVLHGGSGNGARIRRNLGLEDMARSGGPVLVYPDAIDGHWSDATGPAFVRDATFIKDLVAKLVDNGTADSRKIYLVGASTGGMMAFRLACESNLFAGLATVISNAPADLAATCKPPRAIPVLMVNGTANPLIPYQGGKANLSDSKAEVLSSDASLALFAKTNGCGEGRTTTDILDRDKNDGSRAYLDKLNGCKAVTEVIRIEGGGHSIPGRWRGFSPGQPVGAHNNDVDTAKAIWDFFKRHGG